MAKMICKWCGRTIPDEAKGRGVFRGLCDSCETFFRFLISLALGSILVMALLFFGFAAVGYLRHGR
jgi:hypothetical protein